MESERNALEDRVSVIQKLVDDLESQMREQSLQLAQYRDQTVQHKTTADQMRYETEGEEESVFVIVGCL